MSDPAVGPVGEAAHGEGSRSDWVRATHFANAAHKMMCTSSPIILNVQTAERYLSTHTVRLSRDAPLPGFCGSLAVSGQSSRVCVRVNVWFCYVWERMPRQASPPPSM